MPQRLLTFLKRMALTDQSQPVNESDLPLAIAALLIHAALIDGQEDAVEIDKLTGLLQQRFELGADEVADLIARGRAHEDDAIDLYRFTKVLKAELDADGRAHVVEMLWETAYADGVVDPFEANLVWRVAELIGVSTEDRVRLRQAVAARHGGEA